MSGLLLKILNNSLWDLRTPQSITYMWNFGSILGLCLLNQFCTGLLLATSYTANEVMTPINFHNSTRDVNYQTILHSFHAGGASLFFFCLYHHIARGIYYKAYMKTKTWTVGVIMLIMSMMIAFMGYVLPWGQMSYWGATVITNLVSVIPYVGPTLVQWMWGNFVVGNTTLVRFFTLHFFMPFLLVALVMVHLLYLHQTGSSNPLGLSTASHKTIFHPYFTSKDIFGICLTMTIFATLMISYPWMLTDEENYVPVDPMITPTHIKPEWYFLFAYAILRSVPNKLGGVLAMIASILVLLALPFIANKTTHTSFSYINKLLFWTFIFTFLMLTRVGYLPAEEPFITLGRCLTVLYFSYFIILLLLNNLLKNHSSTYNNIMLKGPYVLF